MTDTLKHAIDHMIESATSRVIVENLSKDEIRLGLGNNALKAAGVFSGVRSADEAIFRDEKIVDDGTKTPRTNLVKMAAVAVETIGSTGETSSDSANFVRIRNVIAQTLGDLLLQ